MTFCARCGSTLQPGGVFCPSCGSRLDGIQPPPNPLTMASRAVSIVPVLAGTDYVIEQKIAAIRDTYGIKDVNGNLLAYVKRRLVSFGSQFWFETPDDGRLGEMHGKVLAVRPTFEIYGTKGELLAVIRKKVLKLFGSEWWMENSSGREMARISGKITKHDYTIQTPSGMTIAQIHKRWISTRDSYALQILNPLLDPYIVLAYAIAMDHVEHRGRWGSVIILLAAAAGALVALATFLAIHFKR